MPQPLRAELPGPNRTSSRTPSRFRLLLADDHAEVREEIRQLLEPEFEVIGVVGEGAALVKAAAELRPDAVISDIQMPLMNGIVAGTELLHRGFCQSIVLLSMYRDRQLLASALQAGIRGYVLKMDAGEELIPAVHAVLNGEQYLSRGIRGGNA